MTRNPTFDAERHVDAMLFDDHPIPEWVPAGDELYRRGYGRGLVICGAHVPDAAITTLHGYQVPCTDMVIALNDLIDAATMCGAYANPCALLAEAVALFRSECCERVFADIQELRAIGGST